MTQELEVSSLKQILENETRQKIIRILKEKSSLNYADLMNELDLALEHLFDYHLKELNGLIEKKMKRERIPYQRKVNRHTRTYTSIRYSLHLRTKLSKSQLNLIKYCLFLLVACFWWCFLVVNLDFYCSNRVKTIFLQFWCR